MAAIEQGIIGRTTTAAVGQHPGPQLPGLVLGLGSDIVTDPFGQFAAGPSGPGSAIDDLCRPSNPSTESAASTVGHPGDPAGSDRHLAGRATGHHGGTSQSDRVTGEPGQRRSHAVG